MDIKLKASPNEFCSYLFDLINCFTPDVKRITPSESQLLTAFLLLPAKYEHKRFSLEAKKIVQKSLNLTMFNINNKLSSLYEKGFLYRDEDTVLYPRKVLVSSVNAFLKNKTFALNVTLDASLPDNSVN